ncbi:helix-hairpin-helix domain-containing protein [Labilibacter marinus]|uniref:helix-hairpin-helix domain-containing protein n=1 Tax=Labilibacter marinus TaxID=1477105 RepID=UPI00117B9DE0|nr:helix-hairpin-helix domain-containing protein [Labilibacter marinus]
MKQFLLLIMFLSYMVVVHAQETINPVKVIEDLLESMAENKNNLKNNAQVFDDLVELYERPVELNLANKDDLEKLVFLSDIQIVNLMEYVKNAGPIYSKYQLQGVDGFARSDIERLMMFTFVGEAKADSYKPKYINGQVIFRDQFNVENAKGYLADEGALGYEGNKHHLYSRLQLSYGSKYSGGLVMDKDPGEKMWPPDFISGYAMYNGKGIVKTIIVGDYHANFGQGLAMWTGTSMGKSSEPLSIRKRGAGIRKYSSANEFAFLRGVATEVSVGKFDVSGFISHKQRDAGLSELKLVSSMPETGYHRTANELQNRNTLRQSIYGVNVNYRRSHLTLSAGGYCQKFNADSIEVGDLYKYLSHERIQSKQGWLSYNYGLHKVLMFGELAYADNGGFAMLNGLQFKPVNNVSLALLYRYFSNNYYSTWQNALTENSLAAGESGFYLGMDIYPVSKVRISGYADFFKTNWLKYSIDKPSYGYDLSLQADYTFNRQLKIYLRYREKDKLKNQTLEELSGFNVVQTNIKKLRLHADMQTNENWMLQMRIEKSFYKEENKTDSQGVLSYAGIKYSSSNTKWACWVRYLIFDTDNYNTRLYAYENDLLYNFYTPSFQGEGSRVYAMLRYKPLPKVKLWLKAGQTRYNDREEMGSGLETIYSSTKTNIRLQMQIKF